MVEDGEAAKVLEWGEEHLQLGTFARGDYREFLQLAMVCLGGNKEGFTFRQPGADHHARWMSKGVYYLNMFLLSHHFQLSEEEQEQITKIVTFVLIIYLKSWFEAPLASSAARTDLEFQLKIIKYRLLEPKAAFTTLQSIRRHHWYVTGQMVPLALVDKKLGKQEKEELARRIHSTARGEVARGRPEFPVLEWVGEEPCRPCLATLVTKNSWLIFDRLGLMGSQVSWW